ncbi:MAG: hypothetical protein ACRC18_06700 [Cetobacterium sp.]
MQSKELVEKMLDLLVDMSEHCINRVKSGNKTKCENCSLSWSFGLCSHGCFLVETIDNNEKFIDDLTAACEYNNIEYKDKINKLANIFTTECE